MQEKINIEMEKISSKYLLKSNIYLKYGLNSRFRNLYLTNDSKKYLASKKLSQNYENSVLLKKRNDINFLKEIRNYRGIRHKNKLPVRGQRTHTNAKTAKKKKTTEYR